ncbi:MAG: hypothetical protein H8D23_36800 [Candidatus Brocadiales bacterium]|nr:hypothetical protein [Candidatus Brocadiales bacterium]
MVYFPTGTQARERSQGNNIVARQIAIIEISVLDAISVGEFSTVVTDTSTVTIQGITITGSPMTDNDVDGLAYYNSWQETVVDAVKTEQMNEVILYFKHKGYSISRKSTTGTYFYFEIKW